jgi:hypothetical protein
MEYYINGGTEEEKDCYIQNTIYGGGEGMGQPTIAISEENSSEFVYASAIVRRRTAIYGTLYTEDYYIRKTNIYGTLHTEDYYDAEHSKGKNT